MLLHKQYNISSNATASSSTSKILNTQGTKCCSKCYSCNTSSFQGKKNYVLKMCLLRFKKLALLQHFVFTILKCVIIIADKSSYSIQLTWQISLAAYAHISLYTIYISLKAIISVSLYAKCQGLAPYLTQ
jgi:hypothetical protein